MCSDEFHFQPTRDLELVRRVMTHPKIYRHLADDGCPPPDEFRPADHPAILYLTVWQGDELLGLWMLVPHNAVCWEAHTALLPSAWGRAREAARAMLAWLWAHTGCRRLIGAVPRSNRLAAKLARDAGMREYGVNEKSFLRQGRLEDQIMLGISASEQECKSCQQQ